MTTNQLETLLSLVIGFAGAFALVFWFDYRQYKQSRARKGAKPCGNSLVDDSTP